MKHEFLHTGVRGLDAVLGGGLPTPSFNVIAGHPGVGKTTLAHQILFANASEERQALFLTVVGEPPMKMLRHQQQFDYFDVQKIGKAIHFQNLSDEVTEGDLNAVYDRIVAEVSRREPAFVVVDSFRPVAQIGREDPEGSGRTLQNFVQRLSNQMTQWEVTGFLLGEFPKMERVTDPVLTVADCVFWLQHEHEDDNRVRKLEVTKLRGAAEMPGKHVYRIGPAGIRVYPRAFAPMPESALEGAEPERLSTGIAGLDEMTHGGFLRGDATILSGPTGSGKSVLAMTFAKTGHAAGERVVIASFEESTKKYRARAKILGLDMEKAEAEGRLKLIHRRPLDLSVDETFEEIRDLAVEIGASRIVIDSLSGLQTATHGAQAERLREAMGRITHVLTEGGASVLMTAEVDQRIDQLNFTPNDSSFLADNIIVQRYVEIAGKLQLVMAVVKMRRSSHSRAFHQYSISDRGIEIEGALEHLHGILTGVPKLSPNIGDDD